MGKHESKPLVTTAEVIAALGHAYVCELTGKSYKRVWDWRELGVFPSRYFAVMRWALARKRLRAHPSLWGQVTVPEMEREAA